MRQPIPQSSPVYFKVVIAVALVTAALFGSTVQAEHLVASYQGSQPTDATERRPTQEDSTARRSSPSPAQSPSGLRIRYVRPKSAKLRAIAKAVEGSGAFKEIIADINRGFSLPRIEVVFEECGVANAAFFPQEKSITMCWDLPHTLYNNFAEDEDLSEEETLAKALAGTVFIFFHELGHAFIDVFDIPVAGGQEDAADDFATLNFVQADKEDDGDLLLHAVDTFGYAAESELHEEDFFDTHSLNGKRAARIACMAFGSSPEKFADWVDDEWWVREGDAERCPREFDQAKRAWDRLLKPHRRT